MKIVHVVDYFMPKFGYQERLLPKWNSRHENTVAVITSDRYSPVSNYNNVWRPILGERICGSGRSNMDGFVVIRLPVSFEWRYSPWLIKLELALEKLKPDVIFGHGTSSFTSFRLAIFGYRTDYIYSFLRIISY